MSKTFTFGELWCGPGWPCEMDKTCKELSDRVMLSGKEIEMINKAFPEEVSDGLARGPGVAGYILRSKLGKVFCDDHRVLAMEHLKE